MSSFNFTEKKKNTDKYKKCHKCTGSYKQLDENGTNVSEQVTGFPGDTFCPVSASK